MDLNGCTAIVTGGTGGLGQVICKALASHGVNVVVNYAESKQKADSIVEELIGFGVRALAIQADVTNQDSVKKMVDQTLSVFGSVDILVNDAAFNKEVQFSDLDSLTLDLWNHIININLTGPFICIKAVAPAMISQGKGRIINISSGAGLLPRGSSIAYGVSKAGMIHLTKCMSVALAPSVSVNSIAPGFMEGTRMSANWSAQYAAEAADRTLLKRIVSKADVSEQLITLCRSDSITGQTILMDSGRL